MTRLLISSGQGPAECRIAVRHVLDRMATEGIAMTVAEESNKHGPSSAIVTLHGEGVSAFTARWLGTIQWTCKSPVRPKHKRQNWFVGVFAMSEMVEQQDIKASDVRFDTFRAGGPGGQHQNTTDSAVRATHIPTGQSVVARDERSQHRNKKAALNRLRIQLSALEELARTALKKDVNQSHYQLERGNPVRQFKGERFVEV